MSAQIYSMMTLLSAPFAIHNSLQVKWVKAVVCVCTVLKTYVCDFHLVLQIPPTPECWPKPSSGGSSHRHADLLQEQRLGSMDTWWWYRHPELRVRWLTDCDVISVVPSDEKLKDVSSQNIFYADNML